MSQRLEDLVSAAHLSIVKLEEFARALEATPGPDPVPVPVPSKLPTEFLGEDWTIMGPFFKPGSTTSPQNKKLKDAQVDPDYAPWIEVSTTSLVPTFSMAANCGGAHSSGSQFSRCELRELTNGNEAAWSSKKGVHGITVRVSCESTLVKRNQVCVVQQHDASSDVWMVCVEDGTRVVAYYADKKKSIELGTLAFQGQIFEITAVTKPTGVDFSFNSMFKGTAPIKGADKCYYKTGCYLQSNKAKYGEDESKGAIVTEWARPVIAHAA